MKAAEIAKAAREALLSGKFDYVRVNFANGDMVGHTGDLEATKRACEVVDQRVKMLSTSSQQTMATVTIWRNARILESPCVMRLAKWRLSLFTHLHRLRWQSVGLGCQRASNIATPFPKQAFLTSLAFD